MDAVDKKILALVQEDATMPITEIAERVHLSHTPCWRRIQRLEEQGVILRRVALLDAQKLNVGLTAFVAIKTNQHDQQWFERFHDTVSAIPEVVEFYRMSGEVDYLLRVVVPDIRRFDSVYKRLIKNTALSDVSSSFAMEELKLTTALPLDYLE